ncbi:hypothetical protein [Nesterenkonia sp. K-15-9-6]|uniref:hypothetical protein n=1 Tax=Nesterenkonia sp. K-15-9-6 TaxID=3093918 RepID=UPI0040446D30
MRWHAHRSLAAYLRLDGQLQAAWGPMMEVPGPDHDEAGYRRSGPWRTQQCPVCGVLVEVRHLVVHHDFHAHLDALRAE